MRALIKLTISLILCLLIFVGSLSAFALPSTETDELLDKQTWLSSIGAFELWAKLDEKGIIPGENVTVAVIDTGLSMSGEFENNLWTNDAELNGVEGVDDDNNGYIDDIHGMSLVDTPPTEDTSGHGTMMSGIVAMASGNGGGVGIAYGAKIMPVKISKTKSFSIDDMVEGINYAANNGADVINLSVGTIYPTAELKEAIKNASKSSILIAAAGNEKTYASDSIYQSKTYPAAYPEVIGVMAAESDGALADFTNWCTADENPIYELAALGRDILTTHLKGDHRSTYGTSPAVAEVSGAAAIMRGLFPDEKPEALQKMLLDCMEHKTVYNEEKGGEHKLLYLPDIWEAYESKTVKNPAESTAETNTTSPTEPVKEKVKRENPINVTVKTKTIKAKNLKRKKQTVKPLTITKSQGKVTFSIIKNGTNKTIRKLVKINSKGVITFKKWKKAKTGVYKIRVQITAMGNANFNSKTLIKTVKVKIK